MCVVLWVEVVGYVLFFFFSFLMIRRPPRSTLEDRSSAASDVYKRQLQTGTTHCRHRCVADHHFASTCHGAWIGLDRLRLSLIHISEPTRPY